MSITGVYFVTDAGAPHSVPDQVRAAVAAGIRTVQLRDKTCSDAEMARMTHALLEITRPAGARLIVNDRVDVTLATGADGLHVGQGDGDIARIRQRIGPDMRLGLSVETVAQLAAIPPGSADHLGIGPLRATASKPDAAQPLGLDGIARIIAASFRPCIVIGGVGPGDLAALRAAGAAGVAVVSAISRADDMQRAARDLIEKWSAS